MPFAQHLRITASGTFQNGSGGVVLERWAYRLNLSDPAATVNDSFTQAKCDDYAADLSAFHARIGTNINAFCRLREVKMARIGPLGTYLADPFITVLDTPGASATSMSRPPQVALAVSLGTNRRGSSGRGRFYLPAPSHTLGTDLTIVPADAEQLRLSLITLFAALNDSPGVNTPEPRVTVASSKGVNSDVTSFRVGRALDTIRSRRADLLEAYTVSTPVTQ